jgi:hypothetical protein
MKKLLLSFSLLYLTAGIMHAQVKCPVEALGVKYDKSSPFGKEICTALTNLNSMTDDLGNNFNGIVNKVQNEIEGFKKTNFPKDQISREAQVKFAIAKAKFKTIEDRIDKLIQDRQCGAPGVYKEMVRLFVNTGQTIKDIHAIGASSFTALKELQPIAARTGEIATELGNLATIVAGKSPQIDTKLTKLIKLVKGLQKDFEKVGDLDIINFTTSITTLATNVGPFLLDCSTCAGTIGTALGGMAAGGTETGGGTAASETGVGALFIPVGAATTGISGVFGTIMATPACKGMAEKSAQIDNYITDVTTFIKVTGELAENISTNTKSVVETSAALMELMQVIGEESKPGVKKIQTKLPT